VTVDALAARVRQQTKSPVDVVVALDEVAPAVARVARPGDVVITLGAGSIASVPDRLVALLESAPEGTSPGRRRP
jgi:UDP-N-acetylmuramate--alanine ligase